MATKIKSTKGQREQLRKCHNGVGLCVYHKGNGETIEFEFYLDRKGEPRFIGNGKEIEFEIYPED